MLTIDSSIGSEGIVDWLITASFIVYLCTTMVDWFRQRDGRRLAIDVALVCAAALLLHFLAGYPHLSSTRRGEAFGGSSTSVTPLLAIALMYLGVILGIVARYVYSRRKSFQVSAVVRSLCLSPIILLPMIGSVQTEEPLALIQVLSLCILAFQNGFFWREVLDRARAAV